MSPYPDRDWPLPIGPQWRMVDEIARCTPGEEILVRKRFGRDDPIIQAHFTNGRGIVPGVLLIEIAAQGAALLEAMSGGNGLERGDESAIPVLGEAHARFHRPVGPEETIEVAVRIADRVAGVTVYRAVARIGGMKAASIRIMGGRIAAVETASQAAA